MLSIYSDNVVSANLSFPCQHTPQRLIVRIGHNHDSLQQRMRKQESAISRVLSWTIIHLGRPSPIASSNLPWSLLGTSSANLSPHTPLFGLAPGGVYPAAVCYHPRGALLPHHFTLTGAYALRRFIFCGTFHGLSSSRRYLAPYPMEPGLSSEIAI